MLTLGLVKIWQRCLEVLVPSGDNVRWWWVGSACALGAIFERHCPAASSNQLQRVERVVSSLFSLCFRQCFCEVSFYPNPCQCCFFYVAHFSALDTFFVGLLRNRTYFRFNWIFVFCFRLNSFISGLVAKSDLLFFLSHRKLSRAVGVVWVQAFYFLWVDRTFSCGFQLPCVLF